METILIDEREIVEKFAEKAQVCNAWLVDALRKKEAEAGIHNPYVGGLMEAFWFKGMNLETCINNLFSAFSNNYAESIFFQVDNISKMETLRMVDNYLSSKGLVDDFQRYKAMVTKRRLR